MNQGNRKLLGRDLSTILIASLFLTACGGGGGASSPVVTTPPVVTPPPPPPPPPPTAPANPVVYGASQEDAIVFNLYMADADNPGTVVQLNPTLPAGTSIRFFDPSPDNSRVVYASDQDLVDRVDLYTVELTNPGVATKLNPDNGLATSDIQGFRFSGDSSQLVYLADQDVNQQNEIYLVDFMTPGVATKVNSPLVVNGDVSTFDLQFSPDGTQILYAADQEVNGLFELFLVDVSTPMVSTKVNGAFNSDVTLRTRAAFSPDGTRVVYAADQDILDVFELYVVVTTTPGTALKVHADYSGGTDICRWLFSPDSQSIAYCADQDTDGTIELYRTELSALGTSVKLNSPMVAGGEIREGFQFGSDSSFVVYSADQDTLDQRELYRVEISAPGITQKLNGPLVSIDSDVINFDVRSDELVVAYRADQDIDGVVELYEVDFGNPGNATQAHPELAGDETTEFAYFSDGSRLVFIGELDTASVDEIYLVDVTNLGVATKLNTPLASGGRVATILIPD